MFAGRDPTTGELLGRPHGRNAVPAFDVVLRPTKSVSILDGLGGPATGLSVVFLGQIVTWYGQRELVGFGVAIGVVIVGLTLFLWHKPGTPHPKTENKRRPG